MGPRKLLALVVLVFAVAAMCALLTAVDMKMIEKTQPTPTRVPVVTPEAPTPPPTPQVTKSHVRSPRRPPNPPVRTASMDSRRLKKPKATPMATPTSEMPKVDKVVPPTPSTRTTQRTPTPPADQTVSPVRTPVKPSPVPVTPTPQSAAKVRQEPVASPRVEKVKVAMRRKMVSAKTESELRELSFSFMTENQREMAQVAEALGMQFVLVATHGGETFRVDDVAQSLVGGSPLVKPARVESTEIEGRFFPIGIVLDIGEFQQLADAYCRKLSRPACVLMLFYSREQRRVLLGYVAEEIASRGIAPEDARHATIRFEKSGQNRYTTRLEELTTN